MTRAGFCLIAVALWVACAPVPEAPAPAPEPRACEPEAAEAEELDRALLVSQIKRHFEASGQIPSDVNVELLSVESAGVGTLQRGRLRLWKDEQEQEIDFLVSPEGRWFLRADPVDLTIDPIAQVVDVIRIGADDPHLGGEDADVTIVEYSDFQCPFCARAETIVQEKVLAEYGDRVKFVYKQMPLVSIHPWAETASAIGLCVLRRSGNETYWKYHRSVFAKQDSVQAVTAGEQLLAIAKEAGADIDEVEACHASGETEQIIAATLEEAESLGVNSTPTFFINGRRLSGAQPVEAFRAVIDPVLAAEPSADG